MYVSSRSPRRGNRIGLLRIVFMLLAGLSGILPHAARSQESVKSPSVAVLPFLPANQRLADTLSKGQLAGLSDSLSNYMISALLKRGYTDVIAYDVVQRAVADWNDSNAAKPDGKKKGDGKKGDGKKEGALAASKWTDEEIKAMQDNLHADFLVVPVIVKCERRAANSLGSVVYNKDVKRTVRIRAWVLDAHDTVDMKKLLEGKESECKWFEVYREKVVASFGKSIAELRGNSKDTKEPFYTEEGYVCRLAADGLSRQLGDYLLEGSGTITELGGGKATLDVGIPNGVKMGDAYTFYRIEERKDKRSGETLFEKYIKAGTGTVVGFADKGRAKGRAIVSVDAVQPGMSLVRGYVARLSRLPPIESGEEDAKDADDKKDAKSTDPGVGGERAP